MSDEASLTSEKISVKSSQERSDTPQIDEKRSSRVSLAMSKKVHPIFENEAFVEEGTIETKF